MKKTALILVPLVIVLLVGGFFFLRSRSAQKEIISTPTPTPSILPIEKEGEVEVSLTARSDKRGAILKISKIPDDVLTVEYEISYETKAGLPRGILGKIDAKPTITKNLDFGSCSKNVCVYDEGVKKVSLTLKFNKSSGKSTGFAQDYEL